MAQWIVPLVLILFGVFFWWLASLPLAIVPWSWVPVEVWLAPPSEVAWARQGCRFPWNV